MIVNNLGTLYTVKNVSELLNVEEKTVRKWIKVGKLPSLKLAGSTLRIQEKELEHFLLSALYYHSNNYGKDV